MYNEKQFGFFYAKLVFELCERETCSPWSPFYGVVYYNLLFNTLIGMRQLAASKPRFLGTLRSFFTGDGHSILSAVTDDLKLLIDYRFRCPIWVGLIDCYHQLNFNHY